MNGHEPSDGRCEGNAEEGGRCKREAVVVLWNGEQKQGEVCAECAGALTRQFDWLRAECLRGPPKEKR